MPGLYNSSRSRNPVFEPLTGGIRSGVQDSKGGSPATVLLFNKIQRTAWEVEFGPRKLAGQCSWPSPKNINFGVWSYDPKISKSWSDFFFEKIFSSKIFHWISEQKYFSTNIFEREKIAKCWYFRDFLSRKCGSKKYFCSEIQWKNFEENIFSIFFSDQLFENFGT